MDLDDAPYFGRTGALLSPEPIFKVFQDEFDKAYQEGGMLMATFHPHVVGRRSRMVHLEKLIAYMKSKPGVWFATASRSPMEDFSRQRGRPASSDVDTATHGAAATTTSPPASPADA